MRIQALRAAALPGMAVAMVAIAGCSAELSSVDEARAQVAVEEKAVADAEGNLANASQGFCESSAAYIEALDVYGDVLNSTAPTVGDVWEAGDDLAAPRDDAMEGADDAVEARQGLLAAQQELIDANLRVESLEAGASEAPSATSTVEPSVAALAPTASVERVSQAESDFADAQSSISDATPLIEAAELFNAAAVGLELSWLRLFVDTGCASDDQVVAAEQAVSEYTSALQQDLADAAYYTGEVDGIYGPATTAAVEALQEAHDLTVTGSMNQASAVALQAELVELGVATAQEDLATTAAVQQTLALLGYWDGPVDGVWTDELTEAVGEFQSDIGVEPTGKVDAASVTAFNKAISELEEVPSSSAAPEASAAIDATGSDTSASPAPSSSITAG